MWDVQAAAEVAHGPTPRPLHHPTRLRAGRGWVSEVIDRVSRPLESAEPGGYGQVFKNMATCPLLCM